MLRIINPFNEQLLQELDEDTKKSVHKKFLNALDAQKDWLDVKTSQKKQVIKKFSKLLSQNKEDLSRILSLEMGKPIQQSRNEISGSLARIDFFLENFEKVLEAEKVFSKKKTTEEIHFEPLGVIGNISAWNYPYFVSLNVVIPALLTGNAVLFKPSEYATLSGLEMEDLLKQAGVPKSVFQVLAGGAEVGKFLLEQDIQGLFFTGSKKTGLHIHQTLGGRLVHTQLELGGKDPIYVAQDVDPAAVAPLIADGAFYNTGQSCCSVERIYVHQRVFAAFEKAFVETVKSFKWGDPLQEETTIGPLARKEQIKILENQVKDAKNKGARLLLGGSQVQGPGNFFEPTVFSQVTHEMKLMREESFGPVIGLQKVESDEQAISLMNDTEFGLTAGVYSKSKKRAESILKKLQAGSVYWNCCDRVSPRLPWSGRKNSGLGLTLSHYGIRAFLTPKAYHLVQL